MEGFDDILHCATAAIAAEYFLLPVHGADPVYRERVYCYELYHQLRVRWPDTNFRLNGEIDKGGHPYFADDEGAPKPDMLVHIPGGGTNYAAVEVKSSRSRAQEVEKDITTLGRMRAHGYQRAIYLVYGRPAILDRIRA